MAYALLLLVLALTACAPVSPPAGAARAALDPTPNGVWERRDTGALTVTDHVRLVYDSDRSRVLLASSRPNTGIHAWDGTEWTRVAEPLSRWYLQGAAYDAARGQVVIFGGVDGDSTSARSSRVTWVFDDEGLREAATAGPSARGGAALTYDAARSTVLLTGGGDHVGATPEDDTWLFDGVSWSDAMPTTSPGHQYAGLAFDEVRGVAVLVRASEADPETWEWDGSGWTMVAATTPLPMSHQYQLAWDSDRGRVLAIAEGQVWQWDGATWARVDADDGRASERRSAGIAYDGARHRLVALRAGAITWELDGATWNAVATTRPTARLRAPGVYDVARGRVVYFGGNVATTGGTGGDEVWEWDGVAWSRGPVGPPAAFEVPMAYDMARSRVVLVIEGATWEYDGVAWSNTGSAPSGISLMAFDEARGVIMGHGSSTWTYDGATWTDTMASGPPTVRDSALAYDAARERVVRFGGYTDGGGTSEIDETWEWDGATWTQATPATSPSARGGHEMTYDRRRARVLVYGGYDHTEMWEYDGATWTNRELATPRPAGDFPNGLVYDHARDRTVFYSSEGGLWEYYPVGDECADGSSCASGLCVDGVCCDRACSRSCETCSIAAGATSDGICAALPDAGDACADPPDASVPADGSPTRAGRGGCCHVAGARGGPAPPFALALIFGLALVLRVRRPRNRRPRS